MISVQSDINASASARATGLAVLAVLPGTAHLTSKEAALYINTTPEVLRVWRSQGKGPRFKGRGTLYGTRSPILTTL